MAGFFDDTENTTSPVVKSFFDETESINTSDTNSVNPDSPDFIPGVQRGLQNLQATAYGAGALAGKGLKELGAESVGQAIQDFGMEGYKRNLEEAKQYPKKHSFKDVYNGETGVGGAIDWAQGTLGELVPSMIEAAAGAAIGSAIAPGAGTVAGGLAGRTILKKGIEKSIEQALKHGTADIAEDQLKKQITGQALKKLGGKIGIAGSVMPLESGGMYAELLQEKGIDAPGTAMMFGALATSLEFAGGNSKLVDTFIDALGNGSKGLAKKSAKELLTNIPQEALQEGGQEVFSILNTVVNTDEKLLTAENVERIIESMAAGAVGGGAGAAVNAGFSSQAKDQGPGKTDQELMLDRRAANILTGEKDQVDKSIQKLTTDLTANQTLLGDLDKLEAKAKEENIEPTELFRKITEDNKNNQGLLDKINSGIKAKEDLAKKEYEKLSPEDKAVKDFENKLIAQRQAEAQKIDADLETINKRESIALEQYKQEQDPEKKQLIAERVFNLRKEKNTLTDKKLQQEVSQAKEFADAKKADEIRQEKESFYSQLWLSSVNKDAAESGQVFDERSTEQQDILDRITTQIENTQDQKKKQELQKVYDGLFQTFGAKEAQDSAEVFANADLSQFDQIVKAKDQEKLNKILESIVIEPDPQARQTLYEKMFMQPGIKDAAESAEVFGQQGEDADIVQRRKELQQIMSNITQESDPDVRQKLYNQMFEQPGVKNAQESAEVFLTQTLKEHAAYVKRAKANARKQLTNSVFTNEQPNETVADTEKNISDIEDFFNSDSEDVIGETPEPPIDYTPGPGESQEEADINDVKLKKYAADLKDAYVAGNLEIPQYMMAIELLARKDIVAIEQILDALEKWNTPLWARTSSFKAQGKADLERLIKMLGSQMYQGNLAEITIKEVVQNSFDAVKASLNAKGAKGITEGKIDIITDPTNRIIAIRDNGQGMSKKVLLDAFLTVAGTDKSGMASGDASGGFGMAKAAFLYGNEWIEVSTVKDGTRYKFKGTGSDIISKGINIATEAADKNDHGTIIVIKVPEYVDVDGKQQYIWFPNDLNEITFFKQPLINDKIEINLQQSYLNEITIENLSNPDSTLWNKDDFKPIKVGKNTDLSGYDKPTKITFDWGTAELYISKDRESNNYKVKHNVLSAGVYQFNHSFELKTFEKIPYNIILNIFPTAPADSPAYPFNVRREGWKDNIAEDIKSLEAYVKNIAIGIEAQGTVEQFKNIQSLPLIDINDIGTNNIDMTEFFKPPKQVEGKDKALAPAKPSKITVKDGQVVGIDDAGDKVVIVDTNKKDTDGKTLGSSFKAEKEAPKAKDFLIDIGIDDSRPIFHNNTTTDYFELARQNGYSAETFFAEFGSLILKVKDMFVSKEIYRYEVLKDKEQSFFFGTSIDKGYHGANLVVPFQGIVINPLATKEKTLPGIVHGLYDTFVHEFAHIPQRNHEQGFSEEVARLKTKLASDGTDLEIRVALGRLIKKHKNLIELLRNEYEKSTTKNVAKPLNDTDKSDAIASRRLADGSNGSLESGNAERFESFEGGERSWEDSGISTGNQTAGRNVKQETSLGNILSQIKSAEGITGQLANFLSDFITESKLDIKVIIDPSTSSASYVGGKVNTITLRDHAQLTSSIHEITHAVTVREMIANPAVRSQVKLLMERVKNKAIKESILTPAQVELLNTESTSRGYKENLLGKVKFDNVAYGLLNEFEFLAQAMGNSQFQELLKSTSIADKGMLRNAWDAFVEVVMKALGIKDTNKNAFGETLSIIAKLASQENVDQANQTINESLEVEQRLPQVEYDAIFAEKNNLLKDLIQQGRMKYHEVKLLADKALGSISTRLKNVDPELSEHLRWLDFNTSQKIIAVLKTAKPLLDATKRMSPEDKSAWNWARLNSDEGKIEQIAQKYNLTNDQNNLREKLNQIRQEAISVGYDVGFIEEYWPRVIKDQEGFLQATQEISQRAEFTEAIRAQAKKLGISQEQFERDFPEVKADIISNMILGRHYGIGGPGNIQARVFETIPKEYAKFYMDADAALMQYVYSMTKKIEARKFFGKVPQRISDLKSSSKRKNAELIKLNQLADMARAENPERLAEYEDRITSLNEDLALIESKLDTYKHQRDYTENIGSYIDEMRITGRIQKKDEKTVKDILTARFNEHGTTGIVNAYKNLSYIDTMGSTLSAITQIGDLAWAMYVGKVWTPSGFLGTARNLFKAIVGKSEITKEDLGIERIAQEFADGTTLSKAVNKVFKYVGLEKIDTIGKEVLINNALAQYKAEARTNPEALARKIKPTFGNKSTEVVQEILADTPSANVKMLLYSKLLDFQPVALSEMPEFYLNSGNGRVFYMLKTYTLKQMDVFRREVVHNLKSDNPQQRLQGITNMIQLMALLTIANAGADELKDFMLGKESRFSDNVIDNLLTMGGASRYTRMQISREGFGSAIAQQILPPMKFINSASKDMQESYKNYVSGDVSSFDHARIIDSIPGVGKLYYWHYGRGEENKKSLAEQDFSKATKDADLFKKQLENSQDKRTFIESNLHRFKQMKVQENFQAALNRNKAVINKLEKIPSTENVQTRLGQLKAQREQILQKYLEVAGTLQ